MSSANINILINVIVQLLAIIVVFLILHKLTWIPFMNYLNKRKQSILNQYEQSNQQKEEYYNLKEQLQKKMLSTDKKREEILNEAQKLSDDIIKKSKQRSDMEFSKRQKEAEEIINKKYKVAQEEINEKAKKTALFLLKDMLNENNKKQLTESEKFLKDLKGLDNESSR